MLFAKEILFSVVKNLNSEATVEFKNPDICIVIEIIRNNQNQLMIIKPEDMAVREHHAGVT